jgi:fatty acid desaturase
LRRIVDVRAIVFVLFYYLLLAAEWTLAPFEIRFMVPLVVVTASVAWLCAVIAHNTLHYPVFKWSWVNRAFQVALTCGYGFPVAEFVPGHNLSHHRYVQKRADIIRTTKAPFTRVNALNLLYFFPRVAMDVWAQNYRYARLMKKTKPAWFHQLALEFVACWGTKAVLLMIDWRRALVLVLLPHLWALYGITTVNYLQHDGCDENHPFNHSRNFVGPIFNWFTFNSGFHGIHHDDPGLHWSELPAAHAERFHGRVAPVLEQPSLFLYLVRTFVLSAQRTGYDGTPMARPETAQDEEWIRNLPGAELS